jgi:Inner membrane protein YgaP-like, transmembrane domain
MTINDYLRLIAGLFILASVAVGAFVTPWAFAFTAFIGLNLTQSAYTKACPMISLLRRLGVPEQN